MKQVVIKNNVGTDYECNIIVIIKLINIKYNNNNNYYYFNMR